VREQTPRIATASSIVPLSRIVAASGFPACAFGDFDFNLFFCSLPARRIKLLDIFLIAGTPLVYLPAAYLQNLFSTSAMYGIRNIECHAESER